MTSLIPFTQGFYQTKIQKLYPKKTPQIYKQMDKACFSEKALTKQVVQQPDLQHEAAQLQPIFIDSEVKI